MAQQYLDKAGLSYFWDKIKSLFIKGNVGGVFYGTCSTAAGTVAKVVECADFTAENLKAGTIIVVTFTATNSGAVANLTMNVNGTGAKHIKYINNGSLGNLSSAGYLKANTEYPFYYDGANWVCWFNVNSTYSALSEADMHAGTSTSGRLITAQRLKQAVEYHAPVTSVNGSTGAVTVTVPTKTSELTNDSGYITSAPVTSVNGYTGVISLSTADLQNTSGFITMDNIYERSLKLIVADSTAQSAFSMFGDPEIRVPSYYDLTGVGLLALMYNQKDPWFYIGWMNGTEAEINRLCISFNTSTNPITVTLYARGRTSIISGVAGVDNSWTVTPIANAPTKVSELTNDSGYLTLTDLPIYNGGVQ